MHTLSTSPQSCPYGRIGAGEDPTISHRLPAGLREEAAGMSWRQITDTYGATGVIRLGSWSIETIHSDLVACRATLAVGDRILSLESVATGPIGAMTAILGDLGAPVQIMRFHQRTLVEGGVATFLLCENGGRRTWAAGEGRTAPEAGINALVAGAGRLLAG